MSLVTSLYVGASGLDASTNELSVVGDNIANSSTVGFKSARTVFSDAMAQQLVGADGQMGLGVSTMTIQKLFSQGGFTTTGLSTDVAIQGNGMLVVKGNQGGVDGTFYTRNGQLTVDKDGYLTNLEGLRVQGLQADAAGTVTSGLLGDLQVGNASAPAKATDSITIRGNLDQTAPATDSTFDATDAKDTSNFNTTMTVYDSLGNAIQLEHLLLQEGSGQHQRGRFRGLDVPRPDRRREPVARCVRWRNYSEHGHRGRHRRVGLRQPGSPHFEYDHGKRLLPQERARSAAVGLQFWQWNCHRW